MTNGRPTSGLLSAIEIIRLNDSGGSIVHVAGVRTNDVTLLRDDGTPLKTVAYSVSDGFFDIIGLPMTLGSFPQAATFTEFSSYCRHFLQNLAGSVRKWQPRDRRKGN